MDSRLIVGLVVLGTFGLAGPSLRADACAAVVTPSVAAKIEEHYPGYTLPREQDNSAEDVASNVTNGGNGCLGAVKGDFDGDESTDTALLLTKKTDRSYVVVVALPNSKGPTTIYRFVGSDRSKLGIERLAPGSYRKTSSSAPRLEKGEVRELKSLHPGIGVGLLGASEAGFFWTRKGWRHVWLSD